MDQLLRKVHSPALIQRAVGFADESCGSSGCLNFSLAHLRLVVTRLASISHNFPEDRMCTILLTRRTFIDSDLN
jgi:hypothetical protein